MAFMWFYIADMVLVCVYVLVANAELNIRFYINGNQLISGVT